jgi:hypothetical protein
MNADRPDHFKKVPPDFRPAQLCLILQFIDGHLMDF